MGKDPNAEADAQNGEGHEEGSGEDETELPGPRGNGR